MDEVLFGYWAMIRPVDKQEYEDFQLSMYF